MVDYNGGALSEEEYILQSRGMIIKLLYALSNFIQALLTELVVQTGRILAKFLIDRDEIEVNKNAKTNKANIWPFSQNNLGL